MRYRVGYLGERTETGGRLDSVSGCPAPGSTPGSLTVFQYIFALTWLARRKAGQFFSHSFNTHTMKIVGKKTVSEISETVAIGSVDTDFTVKLDVLPLDRNQGDFEISLKLNLSHFSDDDDKVDLTTAAVSRLIVEARRIALAALEDYFSQPGQARQLSLFINSAPEPKKRGRPSAKLSDYPDEQQAHAIAA